MDETQQAKNKPMDSSGLKHEFTAELDKLSPITTPRPCYEPRAISSAEGRRALEEYQLATVAAAERMQGVG